MRNSADSRAMLSYSLAGRGAMSHRSHLRRAADPRGRPAGPVFRRLRPGGTAAPRGRRAPQAGFRPRTLGQNVNVRGRVCTRPVHILEQYVHLGIERDGYGLMLEIPECDPRLDRLTQGDDIEASGRIAARGGLPVLVVEEVRVLGHGKAPPAAAARHRGAAGIPPSRAAGRHQRPHRGSRREHRRLLHPDRHGKQSLQAVPAAAAPGQHEAGFAGFAVGDTRSAPRPCLAVLRRRRPTTAGSSSP